MDVNTGLALSTLVYVCFTLIHIWRGGENERGRWGEMEERGEKEEHGERDIITSHICQL